MDAEEIPKFVNKLWNEAKLKELLRDITSTERKLCIDASKKLMKLLKGDNGGELLREYVKSSSMCTELLQAWKLRQGKSGLCYVFTLISVILSHVEGLFRPNYDVGGIFVSRALDKFAKLIVKDKLNDIYKELDSKKPKQQKAALLLLASIVRRGSGLAYDVAECFDFKKLYIFREKKNEKRKRFERKDFVGVGRTRKAFVGFAMSFLQVGKQGLLRMVLKQKEMYYAVLCGLGSDDDETIVYVLSTLRDKVLTEKLLVSPRHRSVLFGSVTLNQLIYISGRVDGGLATDLARQVLSVVCTEPSNGIMPDMTRRPIPLEGNPSRLLGVMKKLKATEIEYHRVLLLAIVNGKPSLGSAYLDEFPYNLEDHASPNWFSAISLAADVVSSVGAGVSFEFLDTQPQESTFSISGVQSIVKCICPRPFSRSIITKGLLHPDSLIKHGTLRLVLEAMKLLDTFVIALNNCSCSGSQMLPRWVPLKKDIVEEVLISLPDPQVLLSLLSFLNRHYKSPKTCLKRASDFETVLEHNINGSKKLKTSHLDEETDIIVGGISSSVGVSLPGGDTEEDLDTSSINELGSKDDCMVFAKIWGVHCITPSMTLEDEETYFYTKLLDTLKLYYRTAPTMLEGSFDFFRLLTSNVLALPTILQQSLLSLLTEIIGWSAECEVPVRVNPQMYKYLHPLLNLLIYSSVIDIKEQAYVLAKAAMSSTGAFDHNLREIGTWFLFLPGYSSKNLFLEDHWINMRQNFFSAVVSFLCDAVSTTGNNLIKYQKLSMEYIDLIGMKDSFPDFSPLVLCILQKCLSLLKAESGTFTLPEKTMISLYVSNTLLYLLQTQVEPGLLSSVISQYSESFEGHCSAVDVSPDMHGWRPLQKLSVFLKSITCQQTCSSRLSLMKDVMPSESSLVNTIDNITNATRSSTSELAGLTAAFSFSMLCITPADLLQNFPSVITLSANFLGVPLPLLLSTFFSEQGLLCDNSNSWPDMFFPGLQRATNAYAIHSESETQYIIDDTHSVECSDDAFGSILKQAPFHVLFLALVKMECAHLSNNSKLKDLLFAKLSEEMGDMCISYVRLVFFWFHQIQSSYRHKPVHDLIRISELCFTVLRTMVARIFSVQTGSGSKTSCTPLAHYVQEMADFFFSHPAVLTSLEHPYTVSQVSTDENSGARLEDFLGLAKQGIHTMDYHVWDLVATTSDHMFAFCKSSLSEVDVLYEKITEAFNSLIRKLVLILKGKFDKCLKTKDAAPLIPTLYAIHTLLHFISPFTLLELADYMFSGVARSVARKDFEVQSCDTKLAVSIGLQSCDTKPALSIGLCIAERAFDLLSAYLRDPHIKQKQFGLWGEQEVIAIGLFEKIYFHVIEIALGCELDVTYSCLLKAVNVAKTSKLLQNQHLSLCLVVSRVIASTPIKFLTHCMRNISMSKAQFLFILTEVSPLHMSVFGHMFEMMYLKVEDMEACRYTLSDDDILMLLPTVLSYLNSTFIKSGNLDSKTFTDIAKFFWKSLSSGFSMWEVYVGKVIFQVELCEFGSSCLVEFLTSFHESLLGKAILMVRYYLASSRNSVKLKKRLKLCKKVLPTSGADDLLDCKVNELDGYSNNQSVNLLSKTIAKIEYCRMLLFQEDDQFYSLSLQGEGVDRKETLKEQFINNLVCTWQCLVEKFPTKTDGFGEVTDTYNSSLFRLLEVFILDNILQLTSGMNKSIMNLDSLPYIEKLVKSSLLHRFQDPTVFRMLQGVFTSAVDGKKSHGFVIERLLAHSRFAPTIAAACKSYNNSQFGIVFRPITSILRCYCNQDVVISRKSLQASDLYMHLLEVLKLLRILLHFKRQQADFSFEKDTGINARELLVLLLPAYGATLSEIDVEIYNLMHLIECTSDVGSSYIAEMDYLWGFAALEVQKERKEEQNASLGYVDDVKAKRRNEFRENIPIDPKLCTNTVLYFPYDRTIGEGNFLLKLPQVDALHIEAHSPNFDKPHIYDPVYILHFSIHNLSKGYIEPIEFASFGLLAVAFVSISSPHEAIRKLGYEALVRFKDALEKKDVPQLRLLLTYLQNGIEEPCLRIPSLTAMFVAEASFVLLDPLNEHHIPISNLLMHSSRVNLKCIPMFDNYFWSSSVTYKSERMWVLRLLYSGLNIEDDAQLYIRNSIPDILLSFYSSPLSDDESRELIIEIVAKSVKLHKMSHYLIEQCGLISWLSSIIPNYCGRQHLNQGSSSLTQLTVILQVVNDALSCNHTIEWLQKGALEQLTEFSSHLYKLLAGGINLVKENVSLGGLVLKVLTSALRISQERDVYQPHFTFAVEGIFQMYEATQAWSCGRYNSIAQEGLEAVLMNTPPVAFICMNQEKLLKFVHWAISTAIQSDATKMLQPKESYCHLTLGEKEHKESLKSKLLRWLSASIILGLLSEKFKCLNSTLIHKQSSPVTLRTLIDQIQRGHGEEHANFGFKEIFAGAILHLQQLLGSKCIVISSVVSALCLLLFSESGFSGHSESLLCRIRCPNEANPAWRWSYDRQWKDNSFEPSETEKLDENQACQSLLVVISGILGHGRKYPKYLSYQELERAMQGSNDLDSVAV